jgi:DNA-binding transcriptional LysR family regulator
MVPFEGRELVSRRITGSSSAIYASADYLARHGRDLSSPDHSVVTVLDDQGHMPEARWLAGVAPQARVAMRCNSFEALLGAAMGGLGLTVLPCYLGDWHGGLEKVLAEGSPPRDIWLGSILTCATCPHPRGDRGARCGFAAQAHLLKPPV